MDPRNVNDQYFIILHFCVNDTESIFHSGLCKVLTLHVQLTHLFRLIQSLFMIRFHQKVKCFVSRIQTSFCIDTWSDLKPVVIGFQYLILQSQNFHQCLHPDIVGYLHFFHTCFHDRPVVFLEIHDVTNSTQ